MALFNSKADEHLNILTKFYQVEGDDELLQFLRRDWPRQSPADGKFNFWEFEDRASEEFEEFRRLHSDIRAYMDAAADDGKITRAVRNRLLADMNQLRASHHEFYTEGAWADDEEDAEEFPVRGMRLVTVTAKEDFPPTKEILLRELEALLRDGDKPGLVVRCVECRNPYIVTAKTGQQAFCSNRCQRRTGSRRFRQKQNRRVVNSNGLASLLMI